MTKVSHNHAEYQERIDYVKHLLAFHFHLPSEAIEETEVTPIAYDEYNPFQYNNFVYRITLPPSFTGTFGYAAGAESNPTQQQQPGCVPIPADCKAFILRLSNPDAADMHQETRVQNEVGMLALASDALRHLEPHVVPRVFGWGGASPGRLGWLLQELMPGEPLVDAFEDEMSLEQKRDIMAQMVRLLKALQDHRLPDSIRGWGGVTFDDTGAMVSAAMPLCGAGPWSSFEESYRDRLKLVLKRADENPYLKGWRANGVRDRVEAFIERGLSAQFTDLLLSKEDRAIIHGDFTTDNLLYDPKTGRITALLDFDFAVIMHPAYEFFRSFGNTGGKLAGWKGDETAEHKDSESLQKAQIAGKFPSPLPSQLLTEDRRHRVNWERAKAWNDELLKSNARGPSTIEGIRKLADVEELLDLLEPFQLCNADYERLNSDDGGHMDYWRRKSEVELINLLKHLGF